MRRIILAFSALGALIAVALWWVETRGLPPVGKGETIGSRLAQFEEPVRQRLKPEFDRAEVAYPPARIVLVGLKAERQLELYAASGEGALKFIRRYPVKAASGRSGPKLREGDLQVPEGLYKIEYLNPNSRYHLSMKVSYPNAFDRSRAAEEGRENLGGDIMIHGRAASIGCLAMGDPAAEELFVLAALTGIEKIDVIFSPVDFRKTDALPDDGAALPDWTAELYPQIRAALAELPADSR